MILCIFCGAGFGHIMRYAQVSKRSLPWVGAFNYALGALACWLLVAMGAGARPSWEAAALGAFAGLTLVIAYFLMDYAIHAAGVGITQSVQWLGVTGPIVCSILIWREFPGALQTAGLVLAVISLPLLAYGHNEPDAPKSRRRVLFLVSLFLLEGALGLTMKFYSKIVPANSEMPFIAFMFTSAAMGSTLMAFRSSRPQLADLPHGLGMGVMNVMCNFAFLRALMLLPGTTVFPTTSAGSVVVTASVGVVLWKESYRGRSLVGLILAAVSLVLVNCNLSIADIAGLFSGK